MSQSRPQSIGLAHTITPGPYRELSTDMAQALEPAAGIGRILREEDVVLGMAAKGKRSALAKIADRLGQRVDMNGSTVLAALLRRERLGSTGIGHGVAVPHARLDAIAEPVATLSVLQGPVWFGSPDEQKVDLLLTLLWPKGDIVGFLPTLASFCRLLRQPDLRARLRASLTPAELRGWLELHDTAFVAVPMNWPHQRQPSAGATWVRMASMTCAL